ncbi:hypothetical protein LAZ67_13001892, partial [Cordylochernes scorpioides]
MDDQVPKTEEVTPEQPDEANGYVPLFAKGFRGGSSRTCIELLRMGWNPTKRFLKELGKEGGERLSRILIHGDNKENNVDKVDDPDDEDDVDLTFWGDAARLVRAFSNSDENYSIAWQTLIHRYDNKRELAFRQIKKILNLKFIKGDSDKALYEFLDICNKGVQNLSTLGLERNTLVDLILVYIIQSKLDNPLKKDWELHIDVQGYPSYEELIASLEKYARSLANLRLRETSKTLPKPNKVYSHATSVSRPNSNAACTPCMLCKNSHLLSKCQLFRDKSLQERWRFVRDNGLCYNCLRSNHLVYACKLTAVCGVCKLRHHTLLHAFSSESHDSNSLPRAIHAVESSNANRVDSSVRSNVNSSARLNSVIQTHSINHSSSSNQILLSTALIRVNDLYGNSCMARALVDTGSQRTLITDSLRKTLNLPVNYSDASMYGIEDNCLERPLGEEYSSLNHMQIISAVDIPKSPSQVYYMPHHCVLKEESTTTNLRVVFDASACSDDSPSLNKALHIGPKLQTDIFDLLLRFRTFFVALSADIEKMYRQILIHPDDSDYQRVLWRDSPSDAIQEYKLTTITYGTACAPYLAIRTLHQLADDEATNYPVASEIVKSDFYVDDLLTGADTVEEAQVLIRQIIALLAEGGFPIRKWVSNSPKILDFLPGDQKCINQSFDFKDLPSVKLLGILWDPSLDSFTIRVKPPDIQIRVEKDITQFSSLNLIIKPAEIALCTSNYSIATIGGDAGFERLPNVAPMAYEEEDLPSLIRRIVQEEIQKVIAPPGLTTDSIEDMIREEVKMNLSPISKRPSVLVRNQLRPFRTYEPSKRTEYSSSPILPKSQQWRTPDDRPLCFHCGRPGHVVRSPLPDASEETEEDIPSLAILADVEKEQKQDPLLAKILKNCEDPNFKRFPIIDNILYKKNYDPIGRSWLLVVPKSLRLEVLRSLHDSPTAGHLGFAKTYDRIRRRFYWPGLFRSVRNYVGHCRECQRRKSIPQLPPGNLKPIIPSSAPFQKIGVDLLGRFPLTRDGNRWVIVCTDYLTKYAITKAIPTGGAVEVARFILNEIILKHGAPREMITDRGRSFQAKLIKELTKMCRMSQHFTTAYHPQTNGLTERFNKTLGDMLSMYVDVEQKNWDSVLSFVTFAYNTARQETTGFSPFYLVHGREAETMLDTLLPYQPGYEEDEYINQLMTDAEDARQLARLHTLRTLDIDKARYDARHKPVHYNVGDLVKLRACLFLDYVNLDYIDDNDANFDKVADLDQVKNIHLTRYVRYGKSNLRIIILALLLISGIESNPGPKATRQTTIETSMEKDLRELIAALTVKIDDWGSKIESRLSSIELGMQKFDSRVQQLESTLEDTTCAVASNAKKISEFERRIEFLEMKNREKNLVFYGIEGSGTETSNESCVKIKRLIKDNMQISDEIDVSKCWRLSKRDKAPILVEVSEHSERMKILKNSFKLKDINVFVNKDYSPCIREQRRILISKRKELLNKGINAKLRDNKLIVNGTVYQASNGKITTKEALDDFEFYQSPAVKPSNRGRSSGGILVGIRKEIQGLIYTVEIEPKWISVIFRLASIADSPLVCAIFVYLPPSELQLENLKKLFCYVENKMQQGFEIVLGGDLNIRIGYLGAFHNLFQIPVLLSGYRTSRDPTVSPLAETLVDFLDDNSLTILNGRSISDKNGCYTFISHQGSSVLDLFMVSPALLELVLDLSIESLPYSDHLPLLLKLNGSDNTKAKSLPLEYIPVRKFTWSINKAPTYELCLEDLNALQLPEDASIDLCADTLTSRIQTSMVRAGMLTKGRADSSRSKPCKPGSESLHKLVSRTEEQARRTDKMKSEESEIVETYKVNIKLPPFWIERPDIWFHQVEAQFLINNIKTENTKFNYLIAQLEPKYVENLWDIITSKELNKYSEAKERLLRIFKDGESTRIRKLLSGIELGDLKPSQLLQKLKSLATEDLSDKIIKTLWLEKLPQAIQQILIISEEELDKLAVMADRIAELNPKTEIYEAAKPENETKMLLKKIESLEQKIESMRVEHQGRSRDRRSRDYHYNARSRSRSKGGYNPRGKFCYFHYRYGKKCLPGKCKKPCEWVNSENSNQQRQLIDSITNLTIKGDICSISEETISSYRTTSNFSKLLANYPDITRPNVGIMKANHDVKHFIITKGPPVFSRARPLDPKRLNEAKQEFQFMLEHGIIRPSKSQWASPLHLVTKKDGTLRPCGDYRKLNSQTLPDRYPIPRLEDFQHILSGKMIFSRLDLFKAYFQIPIAEEDKPKTAIITPFGLYEFNVMSFGLRNAPATFQRFIHEVLRGLDFTFPYLDDILVASETCEEHETHLKLVLEKLQNYGLRINIAKSILGVDQLEFLGHWITNGGSQPLPSKVQTILDYKLPTTKRELRTFLGMVNFYRRYLKNAASTQALLHDYLKDSKKNDKRKIDWSEEARLQFERCQQDLANIRHISGKENIVADTLSRIETVTSIDYDKIAEEQNNSDELLNLRKENTSLKFKQYPLQSGKMLWCDVSTENIRPFIPEGFRIQIFHQFHDLNHPGIKATINQLKSKFIWKEIKKDVRKWSQACINCQKTKVSRHTKSEIGTFREPDERFSVIHIDLIGPLPPSNGKYYCLTCIDRYTSWMEVIPLENITSETVALAFYNNWVSRFGTPYTIVSDQGRQFTSQIFKDLAAICGTKLLHTTPYHPQSNGKIERFNRTLKTAIKAHNSVKWTDSLPTILLALRAAIREDTGFSISQMVYGKTIKLPGEFFEKPVSRVDSSLFISNLIEYMQMVKPIATNHNIIKDIFIHKDLFKSDQVFLRINRIRKPLEPYYEGPYPVLEKSDKFFTLRIKNREVKISVDRLKPAYILGTPKNPIIPASRKDPIIPASRKDPIIPASRKDPIIPASRKDPIIPASRKDPIIPASKKSPIGPSSGPRPAKPGVRFELPKETRSGRSIKPPSKYNESIGRDFRHWKGSDIEVFVQPANPLWVIRARDKESSTVYPFSASIWVQEEAEKQYISLVEELAANAPPTSEAAPPSSMDKYPGLSLSVKDGITLITLNRPAKKNSLTQE